MATWDSQVIDIAAGAYQEFNILSGRANMFFATNHSAQDIYISMGNIPRMDSYEKILHRNSADAFGRPTPVSRVYFLNLGIEAVSITVYYTYDENFDFTLMKNASISLEGASIDAFDGVIKGVQTGVTMPVILENAVKQIITQSMTYLGEIAMSQTSNTDAMMMLLLALYTEIEGTDYDDFKQISYQKKIYDLMVQEASTNATILEGINALLQEAL